MPELGLGINAHVIHNILLGVWNIFKIIYTLFLDMTLNVACV